MVSRAHDEGRNAACERADGPLNVEVIDALAAGGTLVTVAKLQMRESLRGLLSLRIKTADGRSLSVRLGPVNARHLAVALARGIEALGPFDGEFFPRT
jgi:hypothetical protein